MTFIHTIFILFWSILGIFTVDIIICFIMNKKWKKDRDCRRCIHCAYRVTKEGWDLSECNKPQVFRWCNTLRLDTSSFIYSYVTGQCGSYGRFYEAK